MILPSKNPAFATASTRPSMITEVSRIFGAGGFCLPPFFLLRPVTGHAALLLGFFMFFRALGLRNFSTMPSSDFLRTATATPK